MGVGLRRFMEASLYERRGGAGPGYGKHVLVILCLGSRSLCGQCGRGDGVRACGV